MGIFTTAIAETADLASAVEGLTSAEAAAAGIAIGATAGAAVAIAVIWGILQIIADWKIFTKAGEAGWKSIIPIYNYHVEYNLCWTGSFGVVFGVAYCVLNYLNRAESMPNWQTLLVSVLAILACVLHFIESKRLARAFGKGTGFGVFLFLLGPIARLVLGFGSARYVGHPDR